jgi:hypothetical protein
MAVRQDSQRRDKQGFRFPTSSRKPGCWGCGPCLLVVGGGVGVPILLRPHLS